MASRTQANRLMAISTPLGPDKLLAKSASIRESISQPFQIDVELLSEDRNIPFEKLVGYAVSLRVNLAQSNRKRYFHGYVSEFAYSGTSGELAVYRARIVPWLWMLSRTTTCRIFLDKKTPDVIQSVMMGQAGAAISLALSAIYKEREYQVQYRETDLNFVSRLLEREGIAYFFEHEEKKHTIVLADSDAAYGKYPGYDNIRFDPGASDRSGDRECIAEFIVTSSLQPTSVVLTDFDFKVPGKSLKQAHKVSRKHAINDKEVFDYPADAYTTEEVEAYAKIRTQELQAVHTVATGSGNARGIAAGYKFNVTGHARAEVGEKSWLVVSATHRIENDSYEGTPAANASYQVSFTAIDAANTYRPPRVTPRPVIAGPQTAIVVGIDKEEITVDEHGRVRVMFHWDRAATHSSNDSCWIRVSQAWSGKGFGAMFIPRHGQEVVVEFLEGDPDKPLITGSVYNGETTPPHALPDFKNISCIKSNSTKDATGCNEIRFDDTKEAEILYFGAQKNMEIYVGDSRYSTVVREEHLTVKENAFESFEKSYNLTVKEDSITKITRDLNLTVEGKSSTAVTKTLSVKVTGDVGEEFEANYSKTVTGDAYIKAKNICLEAETNITIKVGGSSIAIDGSGIALSTSGNITLKATEITGSGDSKLALESTGQASLKGSMTEVKADGILVVKGSMVNIN